MLSVTLTRHPVSTLTPAPAVPALNVRARSESARVQLERRHHPVRFGALALLIVVSVIPPTMFLGLVGKSDWTTSETRDFLVILSGSAAFGLIAGWFVSPEFPWRWLAAVASPAAATFAWLLIIFSYQVLWGGFPMSRLIADVSVYSISVFMLSTPAAGLFTIMQLLRGRRRVPNHLARNS